MKQWKDRRGGVYGGGEAADVLEPRGMWEMRRRRGVADGEAQGGVRSRTWNSNAWTMSGSLQPEDFPEEMLSEETPMDEAPTSDTSRPNGGVTVSFSGSFTHFRNCYLLR